MERYLDHVVRRDLQHKMVFLTGPRQVGKTTLSQQLVAELGGQYLNHDVAQDRNLIVNQRWNPRAPLLVLDEIHKMRDWKAWLKGVYDGKPPAQQLLVTGSARLDTFRQGGESLAGRFFGWRLHPLSVREWCTQTGASPDAALTHLLERGGFPEPCLADSQEQAERWRRQYFDGLVRDDVLEFSRIQEVNAIRLFAQLLRQRVGSPLSLASIARDLGVAPTTLKKYLDILEALYIVFVVRPWHDNIARAVLQTPKVYFFDTGLVEGDDGIRFENLVATALLKHVQWQHDAQGREVQLHYIRTKDGAEVDFAISEKNQLTHLIECKLGDDRPHRALKRFAEQHPRTAAVQVVRDLRHSFETQGIEIRRADEWLVALDA
ncbi:MAG: ATP-binding protein [Hydrogenophaga sp.]|uniref:ATP-binding protein n=1 Tax=Hydrogenophaga sp. TaxID=1904254 RepID=UPI002AB82925|nr:ATP-binding protein [Hydrogenophaga sp.]MDZ4284036.1 ATP-binding protein [Hydrogenophaga sp.]